MKPFCYFLFAIATIGAAFPAAAAQQHATLDAWFAKELTPYVREQLGEFPRFKGEALKFVVMENGRAQATSNALALRLRDRLRDSVADVPGIRLTLQASDAHYFANAGSGTIDCRQSEADYLIGIQVKRLAHDYLSVELLAVDLEDHSQVSGFGKAWQGKMDARQQQALRRHEADPVFRGEREVPYDESQSDLLAAHLAHDLGCRMLRQPNAEYQLGGNEELASDGSQDRMIELVSNNLARFPSLRIAASGNDTNAIISGKAHRIDDELYQYWITVQPSVPDSGLHTLSASAYVRVSETFAHAELISDRNEPAMRSMSGFLGSLRLVELERSRECTARRTKNAGEHYGRYYSDHDECFALAVRSADDAVVFFLHHQLNNGLVRLAGASCVPASHAKVAKSKQQVSFVLPEDLLSSAAWSGGIDWDLYPDRDTFYAIATTNTKAARELSNHIRRLPYRCTSSVRPGLEGAALVAWLQQLKKTVDKWGQEIHWQGIRVKNVY